MPMPMPIDDAMLDEVRRFNDKLTHMPRFGVRSRWMPLVAQALLRNWAPTASCGARV
jgi:hypothetical protein